MFVRHQPLVGSRASLLRSYQRTVSCSFNIATPFFVFFAKLTYLEFCHFSTIVLCFVPGTFTCEFMFSPGRLGTRHDKTLPLFLSLPFNLLVDLSPCGSALDWALRPDVDNQPRSQMTIYIIYKTLHKSNKTPLSENNTRAEGRLKIITDDTATVVDFSWFQTD
jgi:hypothetical protein